MSRKKEQKQPEAAQEQEPEANVAKPEPRKADRKTEKLLRYRFSDSEIVEMARKQAELGEMVASLDEQKRSVAAKFKAEIEKHECDRSDLGRKITNGYESRDIECDVFVNDPAVGLATVIRTDTGEQVEVRPMTEHEKQMEMPLTEEEEHEWDDPFVKLPDAETLIMCRASDGRGNVIEERCTYDESNDEPKWLTVDLEDIETDRGLRVVAWRHLTDVECGETTDAAGSADY